MNRFFSVLYRGLLRLTAPRALREEFGADMEALFAEMIAAAARQGPGAVVRVWCREVVQLVRVVRRLSGPMRGSPRFDESAGWRGSLDRVRVDVRLALLGLIRRPLFSGSVVLTLAVGLGLTAAVLSVSKASILAPLPVPDADRMVVITGAVNSPEWTGRTGVSSLELEDLARRTTRLSGMAHYSLAGNATLTQADRAVRLRVSPVSANYLELTGVTPALGRLFGAEEATDPTLPHAVLTGSVWRNQFDADPTIVGRSIELSGHGYTVIGVLPTDYAGVDRSGVQVWVPIGRAPDFLGQGVLSNLGQGMFWAIGRLAPGASAETAATELATLHAGFTELNPLPQGRTIGVMGLREYYFSGTQRPIGKVALGALLVLLICAINVGVLIELRGRKRAGELAVRSAIGGSFSRILSLMLTESLVLSILGMVAALSVAGLAIRVFMDRFRFSMPFFEEPVISPGTALVMLALAVAVTAVPTTLRACVMGGRMPRLRRAIGAGTERGRLSLWVVTGETALAAVVLIAAILSVRSLRALDAVELGYRPQGLESVRMQLTGSSFSDAQGPSRLARELANRLAATPGLEAGIMGPDMMGRSVTHQVATPAGLDVSVPENRHRVHWISLTPGTLDALGMELIEGRDVAWSDLPGDAVATILSQDAAERLWPGESAIGKRYHLNQSGPSNAVVVGVIRPAKHTVRWGGGYVIGAAYFPIQQVPVSNLSVLYRPGTGTTTGLRGVSDIIRSIDPTIALYDAAPMMARLNGEGSSIRLVLSLTSVYAGIGLILVLGGLASLMLNAVQQRRGDLAIRGALGADPGRTLGLAAALIPAARTTTIPPAEVMRG